MRPCLDRDKEHAKPMFIEDLRGALLRRWWIVVVGLLGCLGLGYLTTKVVPPTYTTHSWVLLVPPQSSLPAGTNPLLALGGLASTSQVIARAVGDAGAIADLKAAGATGGITVGSDPTTSAPVLLITVEGSTASGAQSSLDLVIASVPSRIAALQTASGVPSSAFITSRVLAEDREPLPDRKAQTRVVAAVVGAGAVLTVLGAALLDGLLLRRRRQRMVPSARRRRVRSDESDPSSTSQTLDTGDWPKADESLTLRRKGLVGLAQTPRPSRAKGIDTFSRENGESAPQRTGTRRVPRRVLGPQPQQDTRRDAAGDEGWPNAEADIHPDLGRIASH